LKFEIRGGRGELGTRLVRKRRKTPVEKVHGKLLTQKHTHGKRNQSQDNWVNAYYGYERNLIKSGLYTRRSWGKKKNATDTEGQTGGRESSVVKFQDWGLGCS